VSDSGSMTRRRCVLQVVPALHHGGVERGTLEVARHLAGEGYRSVVVSAGGRLVADVLAAGAEHITLPVGRKNPLAALANRYRLKSIFFQIRPQVVHARSRLPAWLAWSVLRAMPAPRPAFVTTVHGLYSVKRYSSIMARGDRVIAVSRTAADYVKRYYSKDLKTDPVVIYRGIDPDEFSYGHQPDFPVLDRWYRSHPVVVGVKTVLLPGRLSRLKGARDLTNWLKKTRLPVRLVLTATPDDDLDAARLFHHFVDHGVADKVVWVGVQNRMADVYALVDVVVNVSRKPESFGRTVAEALAVGTPVVAYGHGGVGEILQAIYPAGCVPPADTAALERTLERILADPPPVPDKQPFVLADMLAKTQAVYESLMNDSDSDLYSAGVQS